MPSRLSTSFYAILTASFTTNIASPKNPAAVVPPHNNTTRSASWFARQKDRDGRTDCFVIIIIQPFPMATFYLRGRGGEIREEARPIYVPTACNARAMDANFVRSPMYSRVRVPSTRGWYKCSSSMIEGSRTKPSSRIDHANDATDRDSEFNKVFHEIAPR